MRLWKFSILALAATTPAVALPCRHYAQDVVYLTKAQEVQNHIDAGDPSELSNVIVDRYQLHNGPNDHQHHSFSRRNLSKVRFHPEDWLDRVWPLRERRDWNGKVRSHFEGVAKAHLPEGIVLPEPLLPTTNQTLVEVYRKAAAEVALEDMKTTGQKKIEFAQLKKLANDFLLASRCRWDGKCAAYAEWCAGTLFGLCLIGNDWKEAIYDSLKEKLQKKTALEGLVNLGKKLKDETNFKIPHYEESHY